MWQIPSALLFLLLWSGVAAANEPEYVEPTNRLNLRTCPGTTNCKVLRTLAPSTKLLVIQRKGEWIEVFVIDGKMTGWVHGGYTRASSAPPNQTSDNRGISREDSSDELAVVIFLLITGGIITMSYFGSRLEGVTFRKMFWLTSGSLLVGLVFLLNQFGLVISQLLANHADIHWLSFLWSSDPSTEWGIGYPIIILGLFLITIVSALATPVKSGKRQSIIQGATFGFFFLPASVLSLGVAIIITWLAIQIFKVLVIILGFIAIPFVWLFEHVVVPFLGWLATPLRWLWENGLRDIVLWLGTPFIWIWANLLSPLLYFLAKFIIRPLLYLAAFLGIATLSLLPICVPGLVVMGTIRILVTGNLDVRGLFAHGVTLGLLLFDATLLGFLQLSDDFQSPPPWTLLVLVGFAFIGMIHIFNSTPSNAEEPEEVSLQLKVNHYLTTSWLDLIISSMLTPVALFLRASAQAMAEE